MSKKTKPVKVIHSEPGRKGKQEHRTFKTIEEALAYIKTNETGRLSPEKIKHKKRR